MSQPHSPSEKLKIYKITQGPTTTHLHIQINSNHFELAMTPTFVHLFYYYDNIKIKKVNLGPKSDVSKSIQFFFKHVQFSGSNDSNPRSSQ